MIWRSRRSCSPWPLSFWRKECGWTDEEGSSRKRGGSRSFKCRDGSKWEDLQELSYVKLVTWALSGHSGTSCCLLDRWWTWEWFSRKMWNIFFWSGRRMGAVKTVRHWFGSIHSGSGHKDFLNQYPGTFSPRVGPGRLTELSVLVVCRALSLRWWLLVPSVPTGTVEEAQRPCGTRCVENPSVCRRNSPAVVQEEEMLVPQEREQQPTVAHATQDFGRDSRGGQVGPTWTSATADRRARCGRTSMPGRDRRGGEIGPAWKSATANCRALCGCTCDGDLLGQCVGCVPSQQVSRLSWFIYIYMYKLAKCVLNLI